MKTTIGYALTGSFCTLEQSVRQLEVLCDAGYSVIPILSQAVFSTDTRFGAARDFITRIESKCSHAVISTVKEAEPIGPKQLLDLLIISPCTGNTIGKLACGIFDSSVTMAAKAHLRNRRPLLIGVSTNDALAGSAKNIGTLMNCKNCFFIPMKQDNPDKKPFSVVADFTQTLDSVRAALAGQQLQPMLC